MSHRRHTIAGPGQWVLYCGRDELKVLRIGEANLGPASPSKATTKAVREGLLPQVLTAHRTGISGSFPVTADGREWVAHVIVKRTPYTQTVFAVQGILLPPGEEPPAAPLIGAWEWVIILDDAGRPTMRRITHWDRDLFTTYGVAPDTEQIRAGCWEVGVWQNEIISQTSQMRVSGLIRDGITNSITGVRALTYDVKTGYGTATEGSAHLRLVGRIATENPAGKLLIQGVSYAVPDDFNEEAWERDKARVDDILRGVLEVSDSPVAVVDPETYEVLMTSPAWRRAGFSRTSSLVELFTEQSAEICNFIEASVNHQKPIKFPRPLQIALASGDVVDVALSVNGVRGSDGVSLDAVVGITSA